MKIFAAMAVTLDGKIGPANTDQFVAITSANDMDHLKKLRDKADGILFGAGTYRTWPKVHKGHQQNRKTPHFIMSRSLDLDTETPLFRDLDTPLTIFCNLDDVTGEGNKPSHAELVITPKPPAQIPFILKNLENRGLKSLLVEGGGQVLHQFIAAEALPELYLTLSPKIIGQSDAPHLIGNNNLENPPEIRVLDSRQLNGEIFLHLELLYR